MKLHDVITSEKGYAEKADQLHNQIQEFAKKHDIQIVDGYDFIKIKILPKNLVEWNYELHKSLCIQFGVKLINVTHLRRWSANRISNVIEYIYIDEQDTDNERLNFNEVKL